MLDEFIGLREARAACAAGPSADPEGLRRAYLDLLKLALCDLAGDTTVSVGKLEDGSVASRELSGADLRMRAAGMDWPRQGLTMVGLNRLDDLEARVESVVREGIHGDLIEAGAWRGGASIMMRATLDTLDAHDRAVWVADSFQGFPEPDRQKGLSAADYLAVSLEQVKSNFERFGLGQGVKFVPGFFEDTMSELSGRRWALVRLDGDTYEATWLTLHSLYPTLSVGGHLIVDDYGALPECGRAVNEFRDRYGIDEPLERVDWTCVGWRRERDNAIEPPEPSRVDEPRRAPRTVRAVARERDLHVPSEQELELRKELERLQREPLAAPLSWIRGKLRRRSTR
jgi:O-methyltransferase